MTYAEFREQTKKRNANLGGYEIRRGEEFKIHRFRDVQQLVRKPRWKY